MFVDVDDEQPAVFVLAGCDADAVVAVFAGPPFGDDGGVDGGVVLPFVHGRSFFAGDDRDDVEAGSCEFECVLKGGLRHDDHPQNVLNVLYQSLLPRVNQDQNLSCYCKFA